MDYKKVQHRELEGQNLKYVIYMKDYALQKVNWQLEMSWEMDSRWIKKRYIVFISISRPHSHKTFEHEFCGRTQTFVQSEHYIYWIQLSDWVFFKSCPYKILSQKFYDSKALKWIRTCFLIYLYYFATHNVFYNR